MASSGSPGAAAASLVCFAGMAAELGWAPRLRVVATLDRGRVLQGWGGGKGEATEEGARPDAQAAGAPPQPASELVGSGLGSSSRVSELRLPFGSLRRMSPDEFVALLARQVGASGVVAGENYRFGFKAAGDADDLARLAAEHGMRARIVPLVRGDSLEGAELCAVSSTRVREALADGDVAAAAAQLGRLHRLLIADAGAGQALNVAPAAGEYTARVGQQGRELAPATVRVSPGGAVEVLHGGAVCSDSAAPLAVEFVA